MNFDPISYLLGMATVIAAMCLAIAGITPHQDECDKLGATMFDKKPYICYPKEAAK